MHGSIRGVGSRERIFILPELKRYLPSASVPQNYLPSYSYSHVCMHMTDIPNSLGTNNMKQKKPQN